MDNWLNKSVLSQFTKYSFSGIFLTTLYAVMYAGLLQTKSTPMVAHVIAYGISVVVGFFLNRYWSFRGHGGDNAVLASGLRFGAVSLLGFVLNGFFVWLLTGPIINGQNWWPLVPMVLVTPPITFFFNRKWSFA